jgi:hypothetical protein
MERMTASPKVGAGKIALSTQLFTWVKRRVSAIGSAVRTLTRSNDVIPYSAIFTVPRHFSYPSQFSASDYPGLLFCHFVRGTGDEKVVTYWTDENHFKMSGGSFQSHMGLNDPDLAGFAVDLRPRIGLWKRYSLGEKIVGIAALFGAFSVIQNYLAVWISAPYVAMSYSEIGMLDVVEGGPIVVPINVLSEVLFAPEKVTFGTPTLRSQSTGATLTLNVDAPSLPNLSPAQSVQVKIIGTAPLLKKDRTSPEIYDLYITASAKAGIFRFPSAVSSGRRELRIWPTQARQSLTRIALLGSNTCELDGILYLSKPYPQGFRAEITSSSSTGDIADMNVAALTASDLTKSTAADRSTTKVEFRTPPFEKFEQYTYKVYLELFKPTTNQGCASWSSKVDVRFE